jgi:hypothetical protein
VATTGYPATIGIALATARKERLVVSHVIRIFSYERRAYDVAVDLKPRRDQDISRNSLASAFAGGAGGRFDELSLLPRIRPEAVPVPYSGITCIVAVPGTVIGAGFGAGGGAGAAA